MKRVQERNGVKKTSGMMKMMKLLVIKFDSKRVYILDLEIEKERFAQHEMRQVSATSNIESC